jgi:ubiquinone/menaquinone biosynthesis C-methylase UbiE
MGFHTFDPENVARLEGPDRFRWCSREELLEALPREGAEILDIGSGSGFYTDELAPFVGRVHAVDVQPEMHDHYRNRGVPANVSLVTAPARDLPFREGSLDAAVSVMTFHESTDEESMAELRRVLAPDSAVVVVDWSREGRGEAGPPLDQRFGAAAAAEFFEEAGFTVDLATERSETFRAVARR